MAAEDTTGRSYLPRTRKTRALLAYLALNSPKPQLRTHLAALLWSRRGTDQARASLRQSVHELQETLGRTWGPLFFSDRHHLTLRGQDLEIDALTAVDPQGSLPEGLDGFRNTFLEDLNGLDPAFDRWLDSERARFVRIGRTIGEGLIAKATDPRGKIEAAERLLSIDRTHEGAWRVIIISQNDLGDPNGAIASYERLRRLLAEDHDATPSEETEDLMRRIRERGRSSNANAERSTPAWGLAEPGGGFSSRDRGATRLRVAPFRVIGNAPDDGLAVGLSEEVSAGLSRFRWISCIPPTLWPVDANIAGLSLADMQRLGADLLLDGALQYGAGRVRVQVRLLDIRGGGEIAWAGRYDRMVSDPLSLQDEIGAAIVAQVDPEIMRHEGRRAANSNARHQTGNELMLMALPSIYRMDRGSFDDARRLLDQALRADPANAFIHSWLAYWYLFYVGQGWAVDPIAATAEATRLAERALLLDPADARALTLAGHVRSFLRKHPAEAIVLHERAISLNPNLAIAWCFSGLSYSYVGQHEEARRRIEQAIRLSPSDPHVFFFHMSLTMPLNMAGEFDDAIAAGRKAVELNPMFSSSYKGYIAALGLAGRIAETREPLRRLMTLEGDFCVDEALARSPLIRPEDRQRYADGLRVAGVPEHRGGYGRHHVPPQTGQTVIDLGTTTPHSRAV